MLEFFNSNATAIAAVSAAASAIATIAIMIATVIYAILTKSLADENRIIRKSGTEPHVVAYLRPTQAHVNALDIVFANVGNGPARDVEVQFSGDADHRKARSIYTSFPESRLLTPWLPQGDRIHSSFGVTFEMMKEPAVQPFDVTIKFKAIDGTTKSTTTLIDPAQLLGLGRWGSDPLDDLARTTKKIEAHLKAIIKNNRLKVLVATLQDEKDENSATREWIEAARAERSAHQTFKGEAAPGKTEG